jgi:hypothetical protein
MLLDEIYPDTLRLDSFVDPKMQSGGGKGGDLHGNTLFFP